MALPELILLDLVERWLEDPRDPAAFQIRYWHPRDDLVHRRPDDWTEEALDFQDALDGCFLRYEPGFRREDDPQANELTEEELIKRLRRAIEAFGPIAERLRVASDGSTQTSR